MTDAWRLRVWTRFLATAEDVWRLKTDPTALSDEFRPWVWFTMSSADQAKLASIMREPEGAGSVHARLWPSGIRWDMDIEVLEPGSAYRDRSTNGLYQQWEHTHRILPASDATVYVDEVRFIPALPRSKWLASMTRRLFEHRHYRSSKRLPAEPGTVGVSVLRLDCPSGSG